MIRLDGVSVQVGAFAVRDISFDVPEGGYALVIGPTGSGKTTLLETIAGHVPLRAGRILLHGVDATALPPEARGVGFVYQQYQLFPHLSVRDNIAYGLAHAGITGEAAARRVEELAEMLGIGRLLGRHTVGLSGGEQQRVAIARALAPRPRVLLLDEPLAAVDPATRTVLRRELRALHEREGITTLQVTHDFDDALRLGDLVAVLAEGRIAQQGLPEAVFRAPNSAFVARFVGAGNVLAGEVRRTGDGDGAEGARFPAQFSAGTLVLDVVADREGPAHAVIRPEDLLLSADEPPPSLRNRLVARVTRLERVGPVTQVMLEVGRPLVASVTTQTADQLALRPGAEIWIGLKATAVHLV
ncbi:MAG TPA: ABC transporter ATP-binding protein [Gemmatimonadales bacterium]|nr:ABC transporter ATP-binding protein [Gemmatimonadales bacterium]